MKKIKSLNSTVLLKNTGKFRNRLLIATPSTGLFRAEWVAARYGASIPCNWSAITVTQFMSSFIPLEYQVADAYNLVSKSVVENGVEWLLCIEHDNIIPLDAFVRVNEYIIDGSIPVVAGLYFTKSDPPEPLVYRGAGNGYYGKWKMGDKVWADGIPMGFTLIHGAIIREMWKESPECTVNGITTRRIFETPNAIAKDPETGGITSITGTQDLAWCKRVMTGKYLEKAGFGEFSKKHPKYPFLVDTNIFVGHISADGVRFPLSVPDKFISKKKK